MKRLTVTIGIMLVLALCITPVAAVTAEDFEVIIDNYSEVKSYIYYNVNNQDDDYIWMYTDGTNVLNSRVTLKPADIPDAPTIVADTTKRWVFFYLPKSIDKWEIKYYSKFNEDWDEDLAYLPKEYLKNAGVFELSKFHPMKNWLCLSVYVNRSIMVV